MHLRCWGIWSSLLYSFFGLEITGSSVIRIFCFRSSCPLGRLGGGAGAMAHCAAGSASSFFLVFLVGVSSPLLFVCGFSFDKAFNKACLVVDFVCGVF